MLLAQPIISRLLQVQNSTRNGQVFVSLLHSTANLNQFLPKTNRFVCLYHGAGIMPRSQAYFSIQQCERAWNNFYLQMALLNNTRGRVNKIMIISTKPVHFIRPLKPKLLVVFIFTFPSPLPGHPGMVHRHLSKVGH